MQRYNIIYDFGFMIDDFGDKMQKNLRFCEAELSLLRTICKIVLSINKYILNKNITFSSSYRQF